MIQTKYFPILKWKKGEQCALKELHVNEGSFIPVIEITEDELKPSDFFNTLETCYSGSIYFDTVRCDDENRSILKIYTEYASQHCINAYPLIYANDVFDLFNYIAGITTRIAVKIPVPDDFDSVPNSTLISYLKNNMTNKIVDLFLDASEVINNKDANLSFASYKALLSSISSEFTRFNQIVICLTSFPEKLEIEAGETTKYTRYDIKIFKKLNELYPNYNLGYSDYGVTKFTDTELDFRLMKYGPLPKIKYTTTDKYIVLKGQKDRQRGIYLRSSIDMAKEIVESDYFSGKDFSYGDLCIYEKATSSNSKPGSSANWVTYNANHHLVFVMEQLSNPDVI